MNRMHHNASYHLEADTPIATDLAMGVPMLAIGTLKERVELYIGTNEDREAQHALLSRLQEAAAALHRQLYAYDARRNDEPTTIAPEASPTYRMSRPTPHLDAGPRYLRLDGKPEPLTVIGYLELDPDRPRRHRDWNGWLIPWFAEAEAKRVANWLNDQTGDTYAVMQGATVVYGPDGSRDMIFTVRHPLTYERLWAIGGGSLCWRLADDRIDRAADRRDEAELGLS